MQQDPLTEDNTANEDVSDLINKCQQDFESEYLLSDELDKLEKKYSIDLSKSETVEKNLSLAEEFDYYEKQTKKYISDELFWKKHGNILKNIFYLKGKYDYMISSNGPVERSFSKLTYLLEGKKNRTKIDICEARITVKENISDEDFLSEGEIELD